MKSLEGVLERTPTGESIVVLRDVMLTYAMKVEECDWDEEPLIIA